MDPNITQKIPESLIFYYKLPETAGRVEQPGSEGWWVYRQSGKAGRTGMVTGDQSVSERSALPWKTQEQRGNVCLGGRRLNSGLINNQWQVSEQVKGSD